ncbi:hypothetical protein [Demequina sediminicola]|uniref:hypothetical protein n=1 Tax=Demequina sediminicola TaxID=1095026 RepID=UPI0007857ABE|nr:hypothetical protein [Demequina sediminicola]
MFEPLIPFLILGGIAALWWWMRRRYQRGGNTIRESALRQGLTYTSRQDEVLSLFTVTPFDRADQSAEHVVNGELAGTAFLTFRHVSLSPVAHSLHRISPVDAAVNGVSKRVAPELRGADTRQVLAITLPGSLRPVAFGPTSLRHVERTLGSSLDVESADFNRRWLLAQGDTQDALALLTPTVVSLMLDLSRRSMWMAVDGNQLVLQRVGGGHSLDWLDAEVATLARIRDAIPHHLYGADFAP